MWHAWAKRNAYRFWWEIHKEREYYEHLDVGGRIIFRCILEKKMGWYGLN
jgi:hypothetical protein